MDRSLDGECDRSWRWPTGRWRKELGTEEDQKRGVNDDFHEPTSGGLQ